MTAWKSDELNRIGGAEEVRIASVRRDGTLRKPVIVWLVRDGDGARPDQRRCGTKSTRSRRRAPAGVASASRRSTSSASSAGWAGKKRPASGESRTTPLMAPGAPDVPRRVA